MPLKLKNIRSFVFRSDRGQIQIGIFIKHFPLFDLFRERFFYDVF